MKIQLLSDLHLEFEAFDYEPTDCDVVVLAGDIHIKDKGIKWALEVIQDKPVIYVLGNHEFYGKAYPKHIADMREICKGTNIHLLENESIEIDGVNFLGCTLWTDFAIYGDPRLAGAQCQQLMNDFKKIRVSPRYSKLRSIDAAHIHRESLEWLGDQLQASKATKSVVVTHHAPSERSVADLHRGDIVTSAYASDLEKFIHQHNPDLWVHGHIHSSSYYEIGDCTVVCNPRGYPEERNLDFDSRLVLEV